MTSLLTAPDDLQGAQRPRVCSYPPAESSTGQEAITLAALAGLDLDQWQQFVLRHSLGEKPGWVCPGADDHPCSFTQEPEGSLRECPRDGTTLRHPWTAREVGCVVGRQNGKGGILEARELAGLFLLGERHIIHTAHLAKTSTDAFHRLVGLIQNTPELWERIKYGGKISQGKGAEAIILDTGQKIEFQTRTGGAGRGLSGDCVILDEAFDVTEAMTSALVPTMSTRPAVQLWYTSSAVDQTIHPNGLVLARVRARGHKGDPYLAYFEWSVDGNIDSLTPETRSDPHAWAEANPALGIRITEDYVRWEMESDVLGYRGFAVERLGVGDWPATDEEAGRVIKNAQWQAVQDPESVIEDPVCLAFDTTPDRGWSTIAAAGAGPNGPRLAIVEHGEGTDWVVSRLAELRKERKILQIICDPAGPAGSLLSEAIEAVGKNSRGEDIVQPVTSRELAQACGVFYDAVTTAKCRVRPDQALDAAVDGAITRVLGESWAWSRRNSGVVISPLVAVTLALFAHTRSPKKVFRAY